jgi:hypothetical protein
MTKHSKDFREVRPQPPAAPRRRPQGKEPLPPQPPGKPAQPDEIGGPTGPEPTRYGDWERNGRCTDF